MKVTGKTAVVRMVLGVTVIGLVGMASPALASGGPSWSVSDADAVLSGYVPWKNAMMNMALPAWVLVAACYFIYAASLAHLVGKPIDWVKVMGLPLLSLVLLLSYDTLVRETYDVFVQVGNQFAAQGSGAPSGYKEVTAGAAEAVTLWTKVVNNVTGVMQAPAEWAGLKVLMLVSLLISKVIYFFIQIFQVCALGVAFIAGPVMVLSLAITPRWFLRWYTFLLEISSYPVIWKILMAGSVAAGKRIEAAELEFDNPVTAGKTLQKLAIMLVSALLTLTVPLLARTLIGGGLGVAVATAGMALSSKAMQTAGTTAVGTAKGAAAGGPAGALAGGAAAVASSVGVRGLSGGGSGGGGGRNGSGSKSDGKSSAKNDQKWMSEQMARGNSYGLL